MSRKHDPDLVRRIEEALLNMPRIQRDIPRLRLTDMTYEEIGRRTGLTVKQVERQFARSLYKLCKQIGWRAPQLVGTAVLSVRRHRTVETSRIAAGRIGLRSAGVAAGKREEAAVAG